MNSIYINLHNSFEVLLKMYSNKQRISFSKIYNSFLSNSNKSIVKENGESFSKYYSLNCLKHLFRNRIYCAIFQNLPKFSQGNMDTSLIHA